jgi:hypothetical protein
VLLDDVQYADQEVHSVGNAHMVSDNFMINVLSVNLSRSQFSSTSASSTVGKASKSTLKRLSVASFSFLDAFTKLRKATISFVMSVRPSAWNNSAPWTDFHEIWYLRPFRKKNRFHYNRTRIHGTLHENQYKFLIIYRTFLFRMKYVTDKSCRENRNTHFTFNNYFLEKIAQFMR